MTATPGQGFAKVTPWVLAAVVFASGVAVSVAYWRHTSGLEDKALQSRFTSDANRIAANLTEQLNHYEVVMRGLRGFHRGSEQIEYREFQRYTASLDAFTELKGIQAIAFVRPVEQAKRDEFEARIREGLPVPFEIRPPGTRPIYAPITFIDPLTEDNRRALGFDIFTNPVARDAARQAGDSGELVITAPLSLIQDGDGAESPAFVMYLPVYRPDSPLSTPEQRRQALRGWVDLPFRMADLMAKLAPQIPPNVALEIRDPGAQSGQNLLFASAPPMNAESRHGELRVTRDVEVGNRRWAIHMSTTPAYRAAAPLPSRSTLIAISGLALSALLATLIFSIAAGRSRSERQAARLGRLYHALSEVNQAIVRMDSEAELLPLVCRIAVDYGGLKMAWVGRIDPATGDILPVASAGAGTDYVETLDLSIHPNQPGGSGPTARAMRDNCPVIVNDYLGNAATAPWHERARTYGWRSSAAFPIQRDNEPFAVLNVYHGKVNAFDDQVVDLLQEMASDITFALNNFDREAQRQVYERALAESEERLSAIMENVGACIFLKDVQGRYTYANRQLLELLECDSAALIGSDDSPFFDAVSLEQIRENDRRVLEEGETLAEEEKVRIETTGAVHTFWSVKIPLRQSDGSIYALCGIGTDITEHKAREDQVRFLSNYDSLTGLPNRELLREKTRLALTAADERQEPLSLLCINFDRFKLINDSLGHGAGDRVLKALSRRMTDNLHLNATLARLGGDDFLLVLPGENSVQAEETARHLQEIIADPIVLDEHRLVLTASIGIATAPAHGRDFDQLIQSADAALLKAKQRGPSHSQVFTPVMRVDVNESLRMENDLRDALRYDQLVLHYQPLVDMATGVITGVEALVRWQHPEHGLISPARFIPVAEKTGLIIDIGRWVMETTLEQQREWRNMGLSMDTVAVNLSIPELYSGRFMESIDKLLATYQVSPGMLEFELTESIAMEHSSRTLNTLRQLQARGVTLAIDDFGTGYSSLSYLKRYPIQKIKIDRSFVDGLADDPEDQAIVLAILGVARGLGFRTIAEGVETQAQLDFLRQQGCDEYQGYLFARPAPASVIEQMLRARSQSGER